MFHKQEKENSESSVLFVVEMYVGVAGLCAIVVVSNVCCEQSGLDTRSTRSVLTSQSCPVLICCE